jgi:hypothetical protein
MSGGAMHGLLADDRICLLWLADRFSDFFEQAADSKS